MDTPTSPLEYCPKDDHSPVRPAVVRFLFRTNPFYLLSAVCMLGGCLALTNSLSWTSIGLGRLLALIATLNLYEVLLLGLGLYLLARRGIVRDGLVLLFLEALFLVDAAFLDGEVFAIDAYVGLIANSVILTLALVKLWLVFRTLGMPRDRVFLVVAGQLVLLFGIPGVFAFVTHSGDGALPAGLAYAAWWAPGVAAALTGLLLRGPRLRELLGEAAPGHQWVRAVVRRSFVWLPFASVLAHLVLAHWVYEAHLHAAYFGPMLLGLAVMLACVTPTIGIRAVELNALRVILPALAVSLSLDAPDTLRLFPLGPASRVVLTPVVAAFAVAYVVYVCAYFPRYALRLLGGAAATALAFAVGPTPGQVAAAGQQWSQWAVAAVGDLIARIVPKTTTGWGLTAVGAAFGFLAMGAAISLKKTPEPKDEG